MGDDSTLGIMPTSTTGTAIGTTREYVALLDEEEEGAAVSTSTIRDTLAAVRAIIRPGSMLHDQVWKRLRGDAVNKAVRTWKGSYRKDDEGEQLPEMDFLALPMTGRPFDIWSDGHIALVGKAGTTAFAQYEKDMLDNAERKGSPYRKAGLSNREAREAERRRLDEAATNSPAAFGGVFPTTQGDRLVYVGLYQGRPDGYRGGDVTECLFRGPDGRWLGVAAAKVKYVMGCIKAAYGVRIKLGDIIWRRCSAESQKRGVLMYLPHSQVEDMQLEGLATMIDAWEKRSTEDAEEDGDGGMKEDTPTLPEGLRGLCAMLMPLVAQTDVHVPSEACGLWSEEDYREDTGESAAVEDNDEAEHDEREEGEANATFAEVEQMALF